MTCTERTFDVIVVGSGVVAHVAALEFARRFSTGLVARSTESTTSIEAVPAPLLSLLLEFGIHPAELGITELCRERRVAWERPEPSVRPARATAHLDKQRLLAALAARLESATVQRVRASNHAPRWLDGYWQGDGYRAAWLLDASGRMTFDKSALHEPPTRWLATTFSGARGNAAPELWLAALPDGYAYRLGGAERIAIGLVTPSASPRSHRELHAQLAQHGASWLCDGIEAELSERGVRLASLAFPSRAAARNELRVGDSALARDALASQGLALGISDAFHAQHALQSGSAAPLEIRHAESRERHFSALIEQLTASHYATQPAFASYLRWLDAARTGQPDPRVSTDASGRRGSVRPSAP